MFGTTGSKGTGFALLMLVGAAAMAQAPAGEFPTRPVRMIVPVSPGTGSDNIARVVTSPRRYAGLPDVPTVGEAGLRGAESESMVGVVGPAALPRPLVARLHADIVSVLRRPDTKMQFERFGGEPAAETSRDAYAAKWKSEYEIFSKLLPEIGLKPQ